MNQSGEERQDLLKKALTGNAVFSALSGVAILFANRWLVEFLGLPANMLIFVAPFSVGGKWVVALVAELVLAFAILQWLGIRKIRKNQQYA